ncbi:MAG TPA: hypothetical protein VG318_07365 [Actinomycetota bacterium]|nr:hypothetical protein [Actinomycetota bacterium]
MRKRLAMMVVPLAAAAVILPAAPAAAASCVIGPPGLDDVVCIVKSTPYWDLCVALGICN